MIVFSLSLPGEGPPWAPLFAEGDVWSSLTDTASPISPGFPTGALTSHGSSLVILRESHHISPPVWPRLEPRTLQETRLYSGYATLQKRTAWEMPALMYAMRCGSDRSFDSLTSRANINIMNALTKLQQHNDRSLECSWWRFQVSLDWSRIFQCINKLSFDSSILVFFPASFHPEGGEAKTQQKEARKRNVDAQIRNEKHPAC